MAHNKSKLFCSIAFIAIISPIISFSQSPFQLNKEDKLDAISLFKEMLSIPNDAHFPDDIEKNMFFSVL